MHYNTWFLTHDLILHWWSSSKLDQPQPTQRWTCGRPASDKNSSATTTFSWRDGGGQVFGCSCSLSWRLTMKSSWGWGRWYLWISKSHEPTHHHQACLIASTTTQELEALPPWLDDVMMVPNLRIWIWHPKFEPKPSQGEETMSTNI